MIIKVKMKRHESFSIREGWLAKGIKAVNLNPKIFSSDNATSELGIGSNMVKSLKYWMLATGIVEDQNREIKLTNFGELISKYDPYLEELFSWWLIHINIIFNQEEAYIFSYFFNKYNLKTFSKRKLYDQISSHLSLNEIDFSEKILQDEINMIIKTYSIDDTIDSPENNFVCPFSDLNLIKKIDREQYEKNKPNYKSLSYLVVFYLIEKLMDDRDYINIDDLLKLDNGPAKILNLDKNLINEYLDEMKRNNLIIINRTAGLNMVYIKQKLSLNEIMKEFYE